MNKCSISLTVVLVTLITATAPEDICKSCVHLSKCANFVNMGKEEQLSWMQKYPCNNQHPDDYGTPPGSSATQEDFICCPNQIWGVDNKEDHSSRITEENRFGNPQDDQSQYPYNNYNNTKPSNVKEAGNDSNTNVFTNKQKDSHSGTPNPRTSLEPSRWPNTNMYWNDRPDRNKWDIGNPIFYSGNNNPKLFYNRRNNYDYYQPDGRNNNYYDQGGRRNQPDDSLNYRGSERNYDDYQNYPYYPSNRRPGNSFGNRGQCDSLTSLPPDPQSGCCGREASDDDRITDAPNEYDYNAPTYNNYGWRREEPPSYDYYSMFKDAKNNTVTIKNNTDTVVKGNKGVASTVEVEKRISGGKATELSQFPWTVLLLAIFQNGLQQSGFNCGGSVISARYVLTAGHCVYEAESVLKSVQVFLAEYDKRTFPQDCKMTAEGRKCIENIAIFSEDVILHPRFDNKRLQNDIALLRLQTDAPYTEYIRPICLPSINIDNPEHARLPLTVAGWGRNGQYKSEIKQSTTVHLVPQHDCKMSYPDLTKRHLCAAGYSGEDTCRGDSGGPLMVLYRGKYYVVGVVSGKRKDTPCGSRVPSLYTNVYHYLDWIRSNIKS